MTNLVITRIETGPQGTIGVLTLDSKVMCFTLELPWKDNENDISCIPIGQYFYRYYISGKYNRSCLKIENVHGRTAIRMHQGNTIENTIGCILPGMKVGELRGRRAVLNSNDALDNIIASAGKLGILTVRNGF